MKPERDLKPLEVEVINNDVSRAYRKLMKMMEKEGVKDDLERHKERHLGPPPR